LAERCEQLAAALVQKVTFERLSPKIGHCKINNLQHFRLNTVIQEVFSERHLTPQEHIVDAAYIDVELLVKSAQEYHITLVGPPRPQAGGKTK
jgi:hypothetical protein